MRRDFNIGAKLVIGFTLSIVLIATIGGAGYFYLWDLGRIADELEVEAIGDVDFQEIRGDFLLQFKLLRDYIDSGDVEDAERFQKKEREMERNFEVAKKSATLRKEAENLRILRDLEEEIDALDSIGLNIIALVVQGKNEEAKAKLDTELEPRLENVEAGLQQAVLAEQAGSALAREEAKSKIALAGFLVALIVSLAILGGFIFALISARSIVGPIDDLAKTARHIAEGDLTRRASVRSGDAINQFTRTFNAMAVAVEKSHEGLKKKVRKGDEELVRERDKISAVLESISDGVFVVDAQYRITVFNSTAAALSGFSMQEALGQQYDTILRFVLEDKEVNDTFIERAVKDGKPGGFVNPVLIRRDGNRISVAASAVPLKDSRGKVAGCVVAFHDMTEEKEVDRIKSEFVALASHQLRTPLATINWYAEMLLGHSGEKTKEKQKIYMERIYRNSQRMVRLVNTLLNVSKVELGALEVKAEQVDVVAVVDEVLDEFSSVILEKGLQLNKQYDKDVPSVSADPQLTRVIFQNVLSNAIKYTSRAGVITLSIQHKKPNVLITIADTGCGIPTGQQGKIFTKLFRADNAKIIDTDGTGLGLYLVKSILEQSGGKIWFESVENKGTAFFITFPLRRKNQQQTTNNR